MCSYGVHVAYPSVDHEARQSRGTRLRSSGPRPSSRARPRLPRRRRAHDLAGAVATATWIARLSPGVHRTGTAGAARRAPGQAAFTRARIGRPPDSPNVAEPSRSSSFLTPSSVRLTGSLSPAERRSVKRQYARAVPARPDVHRHRGGPVSARPCRSARSAPPGGGRPCRARVRWPASSPCR